MELLLYQTTKPPNNTNVGTNHQITQTGGIAEGGARPIALYVSDLHITQRPRDSACHGPRADYTSRRWALSHVPRRVAPPVQGRAPPLQHSPFYHRLGRRCPRHGRLREAPFESDEAPSQGQGHGQGHGQGKGQGRSVGIGSRA